MTDTASLAAAADAALSALRDHLRTLCGGATPTARSAAARAERARRVAARAAQDVLDEAGLRAERERRVELLRGRAALKLPLFD